MGRVPPATVIVKKSRRNNKKELSHGGWKVAMADLMISMMCLFLVLWLIQTMTSEDKKKLKGYFTQGHFELGEEIGALQGKNSISELNLPELATSYQQAELHRVRDTALIEGEYNSQQQLESLADLIDEKVYALGASDSIRIEVTPQGLRITLVDAGEGPMFYRGGTAINPFYEDLLLNLAPIFTTVKNRMIVLGHTDASRYAGAKRTNWELSTERANIARNTLEQGGMEASHIFQVSGMGDRSPLDMNDPYSEVNRRIELYILTAAAEASLQLVYQQSEANQNIQVAQQVDRSDQQSLDIINQQKAIAFQQAAFNQPVTIFDAITE
ncbi:OmpA family protein [Vibrio sp. SS-MA-C1-2]|uniref:flagellar motor protein MotB n=1 Tax=Vibrio sp. SS-MA-C1-2 TaxID=2908646 RepID=UPI001F35A11A|nr:flagellar motor protein MotB [Vibrio sp. SS-MA-C1-2]UJF18041.1 OmpA family protein [Vibrio sp. SS-MA-C1-2]